MYSAFGKEDWIRTRWSKELSETWVAQFVVLLVVRGDSLQRNLKNETQIFNECYQWFNCFQMVGLIQRHFERRFLCFFATCCLADQMCNRTVVSQIITKSQERDHETRFVGNKSCPFAKSEEKKDLKLCSRIKVILSTFRVWRGFFTGKSNPFNLELSLKQLKRKYFLSEKVIPNNE